ncbi:MAG: hypothetical protein M0R76_12990 [Proteobacteria bacterium]|nr:hypothetical protein [Pseudomonadota bacterium]
MPATPKSLRKLWRNCLLICGLLLWLPACAADGMGDRDSGSSYPPNSNGMDNNYDNNSSWAPDSDSSVGAPNSPSDPWDVAPEVEERADYRTPVSSGQYVFVADSAGDILVILDTQSLSIKMVETGLNPTHVVPLGNAGRVAVLATHSSEVTIVSVSDDFEISDETVSVRADTNALAPSPNGDFVIAFWDDLFEDPKAAPQTNQDISILDLRQATPLVAHTIVGVRPREIVYSQDGDRAFVITETSIEIIDLMRLDKPFIPDSVRLFEDPFLDPALLEMAIDPSGTVAIGRRDDVPEITVAWLDGSDARRTYALSSPPTDLDLAPDGSFGLITLRHDQAVAVFELPLPDDDATDPFTWISLGELNCGAAVLFPDSSGAALYTTVSQSEDDLKMLTILQRTPKGWAQTSRLLNRAIRAIVPAPDSETLFVHHTPLASHPSQMRWSYTLVKLPGLQTKFQQLDIQPEQLLITPQGHTAYLNVSDSNVFRVDAIDLQTFIIENIYLGSLPTSLGYTATTDQIFIAQQHTAGRMTFVDQGDGSTRTVTGFILNNELTH